MLANRQALIQYQQAQLADQQMLKSEQHALLVDKQTLKLVSQAGTVIRPEDAKIRTA
jgi:hypothetical protein